MELRENIKRLDVEMNTYKNWLDIATEERERLISDLALANGLKEILETNLQRTTEELKAREEECYHLQEQLKVLTDVETRKHEQRGVELDKVRGLRREINVAKEAKMDLEADIKFAKQQLKEASDRELHLARTVESLKEREAELNMELVITKERERKLKELIEELQPSLKAAVEKEESVRDQNSKLANATDIPANYVQKIKTLNEMLEKYAAEKSNLQDKLGKSKEEKESLLQHVKVLENLIKRLRNTQTSSQQTAPVERVLHFLL